MELHVYDWQGNEQDLDYLKAKYGDFVIQPAAPGQGPVYKLSVLREKTNTAATLVVQVLDQAGAPLERVPVAWYWPDADADPHAGPLGGVLPQMRPERAIIGLTKPNGDTGFGMGRGAYYFPSQGQIGPHATWIYGLGTRSDLILGLGMIGETNHDHFDIEFVRVEDEGQEQAPPECPTAEILAELAKIEEATQAIRQLLA